MVSFILNEEVTEHYSRLSVELIKMLILFVIYQTPKDWRGLTLYTLL